MVIVFCIGGGIDFEEDFVGIDGFGWINWFVVVIGGVYVGIDFYCYDELFF